MKIELKKIPNLFNVMGALGALLLGGCASTAPTANFNQALAPGSTVAAPDEVTVTVEASSGLDILPVEKTRIAERVQERIAAKKTFNQREEKKTYEVALLVTRYEKGSAFARSMLAGLGQIHIDGTVTLLELPEKKKVGEFSLKKTFAWGGIYGGSVSMEDIERTFADGVAAAVTGQKEDPPKKK